MGIPYEHVNYDFGAADRLTAALAATRKRLHEFLSQRERDRITLLDGDNWRGANRHVFDGRYRSETHALEDQLNVITRMEGAVQDATAQAYAVNAHAH
jgi:hypothetical protein